MSALAPIVAREKSLPVRSVTAALELLAGGATVPFVARYRKEATGGLVHVSALADRFVREPSEVVSVGDLLRVRVISVDLARKRIALSAKSNGGQK